MEKYWVSLIIQNKDDKRAWLCAMSNCEMSLENAMETINKAKARFVVLSAWVDTFDKNNEKHTVFHECYVNCIGQVKEMEIQRTDLVTKFLDELNYPYDDHCVNYIANQWEDDHMEQLVSVPKEERIEIDKEDVESYWFDYVNENLFV